MDRVCFGLPARRLGMVVEGRVAGADRGFGAVDFGCWLRGTLELRLGTRGSALRPGAFAGRVELERRGGELVRAGREVDGDETLRLGVLVGIRVGLETLDPRVAGRPVDRRLVLVGRELERDETPRLVRLGVLRVDRDALELRVEGRLVDRPRALGDLAELARDVDDRGRDLLEVVERLAGAARRADGRLGRSFAWTRVGASKNGRQRRIAARRFVFVARRRFRK
ncbi:MAG: hypothetical protein MK004_18720 [Planctomycetales bacterium]|nr:hypothetical protein [Planctomycetales bacterium]